MLIDLTDIERAHLEGLLIGALARMEDKVRDLRHHYAYDLPGRMAALGPYEKITAEYDALLSKLHRPVD